MTSTAESITESLRLTRQLMVQVLDLTKETRRILSSMPLSVMIPHTLSLSSVKVEKVDSVHATSSISTQIASNLPNASNGLKTSLRKVVDQLRASKLSKNSSLGDECETAGRNSDKSGKFGKLNKSIEFPEILNLAKYTSGTSDESPIYRLYGVVVHLDIMNAAFSGHYVCYVKSNHNKWFKIDDSVVKAVELKKVKEKGAYMLLYARCSPRAPRLLGNKIPRVAKIKLTRAKSGFPSAIPSVVHSHPTSPPLDGQCREGFESFDLRHPMRTILEVDSSSDSSSLFSSCSDKGSCSTESTRDSISTDDLSDYIFGDTGRGLTSPWRTSSDFDTSSSLSSPLYARHSPLADLDR